MVNQAGAVTFPVGMVGLLFVSLAVMNATLSLTAVLSQNSDNSYSYNPLAVVLVSEVGKIILNTALVVLDAFGPSPNQLVFSDLHFYLVPALCYFFNSNATFYVLRLINPPTLTILANSSILWTGLFVHFCLEEHLNPTQWCGLVLLLSGVVVGNLHEVGTPESVQGSILAIGMGMASACASATMQFILRRKPCSTPLQSIKLGVFGLACCIIRYYIVLWNRASALMEEDIMNMATVVNKALDEADGALRDDAYMGSLAFEHNRTEMHQLSVAEGAQQLLQKGAGAWHDSTGPIGTHALGLHMHNVSNFYANTEGLGIQSLFFGWNHFTVLNCGLMMGIGICTSFLVKYGGALVLTCQRCASIFVLLLLSVVILKEEIFLEEVVGVLLLVIGLFCFFQHKLVAPLFIRLLGVRFKSVRSNVPSCAKSVGLTTKSTRHEHLIDL